MEKSFTRLTVEDMAQVLTSAGLGEISEQMVRDDVAAGAPTNDDGSIDLAKYAAWLAKEST